jgi:hypothetical protein
MGRRRREEEEEDVPGAKARFAIGDNVRFGDESWLVKNYHRVGKNWEVMFRSVASGVHRSIACNQLELYVQ